MPKCLECPLSQCRYDVLGGARVILNRDRDAAMRRLRAEGLKVYEIAERFNVGTRTVIRATAA